jgi:hypothetical protein
VHPQVAGSSSTACNSSCFGDEFGEIDRKIEVQSPVNGQRSLINAAVTDPDQHVLQRPKVSLQDDHSNITENINTTARVTGRDSNIS